MTAEPKLPVCLITSPEDFAGEFDYLEEMLALGLERLHVRKPRKNTEELERWLMGLPMQWHSRVVVHGHPELSERFELKGIHYNRHFPLPENFQRPGVARSGQWVSSGAHSYAELQQKSSQCHSLFLSPMFPSISKPGYEISWDWSEIPQNLNAAEQNGCEVWALGGCDVEHLEQIQVAGFYGVALLGAVWNAVDPIKTFKQVQIHRFSGLSASKR